mgnify:CR=1 FL=1
MPQNTVALDADAIARTLTRIAHEIAEQTAADGAPLAIVGIHRRGAVLARRIHAELTKLTGSAPLSGDIDIAFYRDDLGRRAAQPTVSASNIDFEIDGATVVLVDDVLYTGRTIRAAVNELFDFGRPASVQLAVLVDRGGRELPIAAAYAAARIVLPPSQRLSLARTADGRFSFAVREKA